MLTSNQAPIVFPKSIGDLLRLSGDDLVEADIGLCNLICAEGLRGSENLDIPSTLGRLDEMAEAVWVSTASLWKQFERSPADYYGSPAYFRLLVLVTGFFSVISAFRTTLTGLNARQTSRTRDCYSFMGCSTALGAPVPRCPFCTRR